jgi:hypothetical protein
MKTKKFKVKPFHEIADLIDRDWNSLMNKYCGNVVEFINTNNVPQALDWNGDYPWAVYDEEVKRWWVFKESWLTSPLPTFIEVDE